MITIKELIEKLLTYPEDAYFAVDDSALHGYDCFLVEGDLALDNNPSARGFEWVHDGDEIDLKGRSVVYLES